ncbi:MAG: homoserine kinase [Ruminococcaceae bacterium]|nr:homoserine kinase [Oscillospiraceae bacterium]
MIKIRIPATSANIGPGFDSIGLAVNLYNYVTMEESDCCRITSLDGIPVPTDESNLIYSTAGKLYCICGVPFYGMEIGQINNIPFARGLGSSSACVIAGLKGANTLMGNPVSDAELINIAASIEGHPDNSTPALVGGLVTAAMEGRRVFFVKQEIKNDLRFVAVIPDFELKTSKARSVLPDSIDRRNGVFNLSRAALMSVSLYSGNYHNLRVAADDRIHQPYRLGLIKGGAQVMEACYNLGAYAAFISGAGSTLMAIVDAGLSDFGDCIARRLPELGLYGWQVHTLSIDNVGTVIEKEEDGSK